jgi:hypothetical protein
MERKAPIYVRIDDYKDIVDILTLLRKKISDAKGIIGQINALKNEEDNELDQWNTNLEEIQKKTDYLNRNLFE